MRTGLELLVIFVFLSTIQSQSPTKIYSKPGNGVDLININADGRALAYASNLQMDQTDNSVTQTLYFTADRGSPNIYTAQFTNTGPSAFSFWTTAVSLVTDAAPYLTFDVYKQNIIGPAFPNSNARAPTFSIQTIYLGTNPPDVENVVFPGFTFFSVLIDPEVQTTGKSWVYLAGWGTEGVSTDPFVVARASVFLNRASPLLELDHEDVLPIPFTSQCYDEFDEVLRPQMNLSNGNLTLAIPGRCGRFARISLSSDPFFKLSNANVKLFDPLSNSQNQLYVSSAVYDSQFEVIYYTLKKYNYAGSVLYSFNAAEWKPNSPSLDLSHDEVESETLIILGTEQQTKYIYIVAAGAHYIQRFEVTNNFTYITKSFAYINPSINRISSAYHYFPYLYITTYEPDAKLYRISRNNFCGGTCGTNSYCLLAVCYCLDGYTKDTTDAQTPCKPTQLVQEEIAGRETQGAAAALGVLFAFSLLAAITGWVLWYRGSKKIVSTTYKNVS